MGRYGRFNMAALRDQEQPHRTAPCGNILRCWRHTARACYFGCRLHSKVSEVIRCYRTRPGTQKLRTAHHCHLESLSIFSPYGRRGIRDSCHIGYRGLQYANTILTDIPLDATAGVVPGESYDTALDGGLPIMDLASSRVAQYRPHTNDTGQTSKCIVVVFRARVAKIGHFSPRK